MNIAAVSVFYRPQDDALDAVRLLAGADIKFIAVVNEVTPAFAAALAAIAGVSVISNDGNIGLASALNQGIRAAMSQPGIDNVLLLDQDSKPTLEMVKALSESMQELIRRGEVPACVAPRLVDRKAPTAEVRSVTTGGDAEFRIVESVATSGTLVPRQAFERVGLMMDQLFIDSIDHEWCLRALSRGMKPVVAERAVMMHDMGEGAVNLFGRFKPLHRSPVRHYYIIRNNLLMMRLPYVPLKWKIKELFKTARRFIAYLLISNDRRTTFTSMCKAVVHGTTSRILPLQ